MNQASHATWKSRLLWIGYLLVASCVAHLMGCWLFLLALGMTGGPSFIWEGFFFSLTAMFTGFPFIAATWAMFTLPLSAVCAYLKWYQNLWLTTGVGLASGALISGVITAVPGALVAALFSAFTREWGGYTKSKSPN